MLGGGLRDRNRVFGEVRQLQLDQQPPAVGVRVGAHTAVTLRRQAGEFRAQPSLLVEELLRLVATQPFL